MKRNPLPLLPESGEKRGRFPSWLHRPLPQGGTFFQTDDLLRKYRLNTVCEEAKCPNRSECYSKKTATFLALGKACSRRCGFCSIDFAKAPAAPEQDEPARIAASCRDLGLKHAVITMVARDDLPDGGAEHLVRIMQACRKENPGMTLELLTSDFQGNLASLTTILAEKPEIFNHNIETVRRLSPRVRHKATYDRTLELLRYVSQSDQAGHIKSGLMVGLGETDHEVEETLHDLKTAGCDIVTIGHYLQPTANHLRVKAFITPEQFDHYAAYGHRIGIRYVYSGPFVRSSYNAHEIHQKMTALA